MKADEVFADAVREARERAGLTHERLALLAGCTPTDVREMESGAYPYLVVAMKLALALDEVEAYLRYAQTFGLRARVEALEVAVPLALDAMKRRAGTLEVGLGERS